MSRWVGRFVLAGGVLSAMVLVPVGVMMTVFGFAQAVIDWFGFAENETNRGIVIGILGLTFAINMVPLVLFWIAWSSGSAARVWLGLTMLLLSPFFGWIGFYGLILQGDWGDFVLWGPYLLTGLFLATVGALIVAGRWDA
jgi:hypothetical protein